MLMKLRVLKEAEYDVDDVEIIAAVRYEEEDMPNDYPGRDGDTWHVHIDPNTGKLKNWPGGRPLELHMKVCDQGTYRVRAGNELIHEVNEDYVPSYIPGSYGDYIELNITANGTITNWSRQKFASAVKDAAERALDD